MVAEDYLHKANCAMITKRLLLIGVPGHMIKQSVDLKQIEIDSIAEELGPLAPKPVSGARLNSPENYIQGSVRRAISSTVLVTLYFRLRENTPNLGFAELFAPAWDSFVSALKPLTPAQLDIDARKAWSLLRFIEDGALQTAKCECCGSYFPRIGVDKICVLCSQISFTHCQECEDPLPRGQRLYDRKWKEGKYQAVCAQCRKKLDQRNAQRYGQIASSTLSTSVNAYF